MKKIAFALATLALLGAGCKQSALPEQKPETNETSDAGGARDSGIPAGWVEYKNEEWGVSLAVPAGWQHRERSKAEVGNQDILWVDFSRQPIVFREGSDIFYPMGLQVSRESLADELTQIQNKLSQTSVQISNKSFLKVRYHDESSNTDFDAYLLEVGGKTYSIDGEVSITELAQIVATLEVK